MVRNERSIGRAVLALGGLVVCIVTLACLFAGSLAPHNPLQINLPLRLQPPGDSFFLGSDHLGRCVWSRVIHGSRISLSIAAAATTLSLGLGMSVAILWALLGKRMRMPFQWCIDISLAFPGILLALILSAFFSTSSTGLILTLGLAGYAWWARLIFTHISHAQEKAFVLAGKSLGVTGWRLLRGYLLPQILPAVVTAASLRISWNIMAISALSYLGLGIQAPAPEWGAMLQESRLYLTKAPWLMVVPGAAITLTIFGLNLFAEGLRDVLRINENSLI